MHKRVQLGFTRIGAYIRRRMGLLSSTQSKLIHEITHLINDLRLELWYTRKELGELRGSLTDSADDVQYKKDLEACFLTLTGLERTMVLLAETVAADEKRDISNCDVVELLSYVRVVRMLLSWR